ncbi:helicase-related protein [Planctomicrobium sp. SH664]|uniref:helicase-related protein n=1 Tax=Planctomicrobium sp. SH664 TaxID=3448125 RepID=UPI003F5B5056
MPAPGKWLPLEEARTIVVQQGFKRQADFYAWTDRPANIPSNPRGTYGDDWRGWEYFLGVGPAKERSRPKTRIPFLEFESAKQMAQQLMPQYGITTQSQWHVWVKTADKPADIPADPSKAYKDKGWISWPDWLGREPGRASGHEQVRSFLEAREFARSLGLKSEDEWREWAKAHRPDDIPQSPDARYKDEGWIGWGDFLGYRNRWTHREIAKFLDSLEPCIEQLTELDLYLILSKNGMLRRDARLRAGKLLRGLKNARTQEDLQKAKQQLTDALDKKPAAAAEQDGEHNDLQQMVSDEDLFATDGSSLRRLDILDALQTVDRVTELNISDDAEVLDFMVSERVMLLWQEAMASGEAAMLDRLNSFQGGTYATLIKEQFTDSYRRVMALDVPGEYRLVDAAGQPADLNLMQRLTAYRLLHDKRVGNWSGVGAGKTHAAIFGAAVLASKFTVVLAANATIAGWKRSIERSFAPDSFHVHAGSPLAFRSQPGKKNFLVINYESFQQQWTTELLNLLLSQVPIDFVVLDEVQFARQRHQSEARKSQRRQHVDDLIRRALDRNPELRILAMSATPVVNNLREAVNVLTLLWPERDFSRIPVGVSIANAVNVHRHLREHGIRHVPRYEQQLIRKTVVIDGQPWLSRLEHLRPKDLLLMEQTLLEAKLPHVAEWVRRGTLIYTQYVEEIVEPVKRAVEGLGLRIAAFTGKERISLEEFRQEFEAKRMDVLIGSAPIGTGVDGLQFLLDRLVFLTLPWSHADYEQIVGRLWRQGSKFHQIEVIIPQVTLREERAGQWSWDDLRLRCIEYKQTLADAALDGVIPRGGLPSQQELHRRSLNALKLWKESVSKGLPDSTGEA